MKFWSRGFTLIELLVVIAIIGILATVILTSLNDARTAGINEKVRSEMDSIAKRAAIENAQVFTYDMVCGSNGIPTSTTIAGLITSIETFASSTVACNSRTSDYAVSVAIGNAYWCIDSAGIKKEIPDALLSTEFACP